MPERNQRIHFQRPPCREITRNTSKGRRIRRADTIEHRFDLNQRPNDERSGEANQETDSDRNREDRG